MCRIPAPASVPWCTRIEISKPRLGLLAPIDWACREHMAPERAPEHLLGVTSARDQLCEVDSGLVPHLVQHRHQVLGRDVAGRPLRHRDSRRARRTSDSNELTPASSAATTLARPWPRVLWKCAVTSARQRRAPSKKPRTWAGLAMPVVSPNAISSQPASIRRARDREHPLRGHLALVGAAERHRDHALAAQPLLARACDDPLQPGQRLLDRAVHVLLVVRLRGREEEVDLLEVLAQLQRVVEPLLVRDQHRHGHFVRDRRRAAAPRRRRRAAGSRRRARSS